MSVLPSASTTNPLDNLPMHWRQYLVVAITVLLNALDGFDVLSISFASPGIAEQWNVERGALGIVLSMELIGMAIGSIFLGQAADRYGRRALVLFCLILMASGMALASTADNITQLSIWRVMTGLGIGGMLAVTNAIASEVSNKEKRSLAISIMVIGYPIGAVAGGTAVSYLLQSNSWPIIFEVGAIATALMIPLVWFALPETPAFLAAQGRPDSLDRVNRSMVAYGQPPLLALPERGEERPKLGLVALFSSDIKRTTILLTLAYFTQIITFYFILKWTPKVVTDLGFTPSLAAGVLVWANIGGAIGGTIWGLLATKIPIRPLALATFLASAIMVTAFGAFGSDLFWLSLLAALGGFCTNSAMVALYNLAATSFPDHLRATGTGFVIGAGRGGAVLGPIIAGYLFEAGVSLPLVAGLMASGSLVALLAVVFLPTASVVLKTTKLQS